MEFSNVTSTSLTLHWKPPARDGGSHITGYLIEAKLTSSKEWEKIGSVEGYTTKYKVKDLEAGTEYIFRVSATNAIGSGEYQESDPVIPRGPLGNFNLTISFHLFC